LLLCRSSVLQFLALGRRRADAEMIAQRWTGIILAIKAAPLQLRPAIVRRSAGRRQRSAKTMRRPF
jgi:hypothetical protein